MRPRGPQASCTSNHMWEWVSGKLPPRKIAPRPWSGFGLGLALELGLGGNFPRTVRMYSFLTTFAERKNTIFLLLFLKESINQILASNKDFMFFFVTFLFQFEKNIMLTDPQNEKSNWSGLIKHLVSSWCYISS